MVFSVRYRRRFDIVADIIDVAQQGARKTKIMYFANLSHLLLTRYLDDAVRAGFLKSAGDMFFATPKGQDFLDKYQRLTGRASRLEADLEELRSEADELERMCRPRRNGGKGCRRSRLAVLG
jgi:predicted transcriptional regulator